MNPGEIIIIDTEREQVTMKLDAYRRLKDELDNARARIAAMEEAQLKPLPAMTWAVSGQPVSRFIDNAATGKAGLMVATESTTQEMIAAFGASDWRYHASQRVIRRLCNALDPFITIKHYDENHVRVTEASLVVGKA